MKNNICPKTLSGKHKFENDTKTIGHEGYFKHVSSGWFGLDLKTFWVQPDIKVIKLKTKSCIYCGIINDTKK
jgi:type IV secretory pathway VirJ component